MHRLFMRQSSGIRAREVGFVLCNWMAFQPSHSFFIYRIESTVSCYSNPNHAQFEISLQFEVYNVLIGKN